MTKFELLTSITDVKEFINVFFDIIDVKKDKESVRRLLEEELTEEELQMAKSAAREGYPLSSSFKQ